MSSKWETANRGFSQNLYDKNTLSFPGSAVYFTVGPRHDKTNKRSKFNFIPERLVILTTFLNVSNYPTTPEVLDIINDLIADNRPDIIIQDGDEADTTQGIYQPASSSGVEGGRDDPGVDIPATSDTIPGAGASSSSARAEVVHDGGDPEARPAASKKKKKKKRKVTEE